MTTDRPAPPRKFIYVKQYTRSIGRQCMHCGRPATVTAVDDTNRARHGVPTRHNVRYCEDHARHFGAIE